MTIWAKRPIHIFMHYIDIFFMLESSNTSKIPFSESRYIYLKNRLVVRSKVTLQLLDEMQQRRLEPNVISFIATISACEKGRQWEKALQLLDEMQQRRLEPDVISFNAAISACGKGGQWDKALQLLDEMPQRRLDPDVISFSAAISACEKSEQWEKALELLDEMQQRKLEPDVISFSAAISRGPWDGPRSKFSSFCAWTPTQLRSWTI